MKTADYLFPRDLQVSPSGLSKLLFIGSCLSEFYVDEFRKLQPELEIEHILFNNAQRLPVKSLDELSSYTLQYIQLPLRNVLTDGVIRRARAGQVETDWLEVGKANLDAMLSQALRYCTESGLLTLVANFVVPQGRIAPSLSDFDTDRDMTHVVRELNAYLSAAIKRHANVYVADVDMIANTLGKKYFLDDMVYFFTHGVALSLDSFLAVEAEQSLPAPSRLDGNMALVQRYESKVDEYYEAIYRQVDAIHRTVHQIDSIKLVVFDLDNTLWRGLIGEHYEPGSQWPQLHGWPTGVWDAINQLRERGILVSLCSKNDEGTVINKWRYAVPLGFVELSDFLVSKINWLPKSENIASILESLSLTPKNVLFVDDNPIEREAVRVALPGIRVIGADPYAIKRVLLWSPQTQIPRLSAESVGREASLQGKVKRDQARAVLPRSEFLASLQTEVKIAEIHSVDDPSFYRVSELVNKTNQFNTVGARRSVDDYLLHWREGGRLFAFTVNDRFSEYGLVGVLFVLANCVTQFVMSCRVLGMEIETAVLRAVIHKIRGQVPGAPVSGLVIHTDKNTPSRDVFTTSGFQSTANPQMFISVAPLPEVVGAHVHIRWSGHPENALYPTDGGVPQHMDKLFEQHAVPVLPRIIQIAFIGNSLTLHEPSYDIGWHHSHGMAASEASLDYVHQTLLLLGIHPENAYIRNFYPFENDVSVTDGHLQSLEPLWESRPPVVVLQLGDNVGSQMELNNLEHNFKLLVESASRHEGRVFCLSTWWKSPIKDKLIETLCHSNGGTFVYIGDLYAHQDNTDRQRQTYVHAGVENHPKDWAMLKIAERLVAAIQSTALEKRNNCA